MTFAIITMHDEYYAEVGELTLQNKKEYCEFHGYQLFAKVDNFSQGRHIYLDKIRHNLLVLEQNPQLEWVWWLDCDAVITNFHIPMQTYCNDDYDFIATVDRYALNNGSYFIKNSNRAKQFFKRYFGIGRHFR
jgi:xyloglucan 6-xylosyltransferase